MSRAFASHVDDPGADNGAREKAEPRDLSKLRIAFVSGNYNMVRDGANRAQNELVRYLLARGAAVRVYSPTCDRPAFAPAGDLVSIPSIPMLFGRGEYRVCLRLPHSIRADIEAFRPSLFHISLPFFHGKSALALAHQMNLPAVAAMHTRFETYPRYYRLGFMEGSVIASLRRFYRGCDQIVAPSQSAATIMEQQGMGENIAIWSRGVDHMVFNPDRRDPDWRRSMGFAENDVVIAFLGRLVMEKGLADFVAVIERLRRHGRKFRLLIIGDGPARNWFAERLGDAVFAGFQHGEGLSQALASADILLNPSATEAFGNVSLEAMACGVPVVAADAPGNNNLVVDGHTGALVRPGDIESYAVALESYLIDEARRADHGRNAWEHSGAFTWDVANAAVVDAYIRALGN